jgi:hypothetical protein
MSRKSRPAEDVFWDNVNPEPNTGCWIWGGSTNSGGYGQMQFNKRNAPAHRVSYILAGKTIPEGFDLDHLCRNRWCVNPDHLEPVTRSENVKRGIGRELAGQRQASKTHCPRGHLYAGENLPAYTRPTTGTVHRHCVACKRARNKQSYERLKNVVH